MKKLHVFILFSFISALGLSQQDSTKKEIYTIVEEMPEFPGGPDAMMKWIHNKIMSIGYPQAEKEAGISGTSYVTFIVDEGGNVIAPQILKSATEGYDKVSLKVVTDMPKWKPGKQNGKVVSVQYNLPIKYTIKGVGSSGKKQ